MTEKSNKWDFIVDPLKKYVSETAIPWILGIFPVIITGSLASLLTSSNLAIALTVIFTTIFCAAIFLFFTKRARKLEAKSDISVAVDTSDTWRKQLFEKTGIHGFAPTLQGSDYIPQKILEKPQLGELIFLGHGCSKWTKLLDDDVLGLQIKNVFHKILASGGRIRFLAADPRYLAKDGVTDKARKNAQSLIKLLNLQKELNSQYGKFDIKIYHEAASWRLTFLNDQDCIVGHYGGGNSSQTPLLLVKKPAQDNELWGFYAAFRHVFEMKWGRSDDISWFDKEKIVELKRIAENIANPANVGSEL